ncbi:type II toxin-antitoxin system Phd/YefM family antitoxin [Acidipila sp. EB88]|uniref:type II toxin-antitoxin system Phd/YefM family antitoxin n=1 Tax=Acidipila sp. EB88 TaxID=2305226 RepID=UPI000F5D8CB9|nr:type II toxin-antitoxin system prevent-host-death family antitoxin [Acidipila sp. EB88]RRA48810.1 type II toxin-antitoxin system prevent-host-death family antitoxin [Acidipila sp. EB88]
MEYTVHEAKTQFSKLLAKVAAGEEVTITSGKERKPVARLVKPAKAAPRRLGWLAGKAPIIGPEFWESLPDEELKAWEGGE